MNKRMLLPVIVVVLLCAMLPQAFAEVAELTGYVNGGDADRVHLRAAPAADADSLGLYFTGVPLVCHTDPTAPWVHVTIGQVSGYMMSRYVYCGTAPETVPIVQFHACTTSADPVPFRTAPAEDAYWRYELPEGTPLLILGETADRWYYVYSDNFCGYVPSETVFMGDRAEQPIRHGYPAPELSRVAPRFHAVLYAGESFRHAQSGDELALHELSRLYGGQPVTFPCYTFLDVDRDGERELVLALTIGTDEYYGYLVLDAIGSNVYGYEFVYRAMNDLKTDGTFSFSSGAADGGFGYAVLDGQPHTVPLARSCSDGEDVQYFEGSEQISPEAFYVLWDEQISKPSAEWYLPEAVR